jgi:hypothetical protein
MRDQVFGCLLSFAFVLVGSPDASCNDNGAPSDRPAVTLFGLHPPLRPLGRPALRDALERIATSDIALDRSHPPPITGTPLRCRKSTGVLVGIVGGGIAGALIGARTWKPNWVFSRRDETMIGGVIGAGLGAFAGYHVCGG